MAVAMAIMVIPQSFTIPIISIITTTTETVPIPLITTRPAGITTTTEAPQRDLPLPHPTVSQEELRHRRQTVSQAELPLQHQTDLPRLHPNQITHHNHPPDQIIPHSHPPDQVQREHPVTVVDPAEAIVELPGEAAEVAEDGD